MVAPFLNHKEIIMFNFAGDTEVENVVNDDDVETTEEEVETEEEGDEEAVEEKEDN